MLLDTWGVYNISVEIQQSFAIREEEGSLSLHLTPDKHVLCCQRDLLISLRDIGANSRHDALLGEVDLRIEVRQTELTSASAARGHLDHAERGAMQREKQFLAPCRVVNVYFTRQFFASNGLMKQGHRVFGFASPFNDTIHAQFFVRMCILDLPTARPPHNYFEILTIEVVLDLAKEQTGVVRVDGHTRRPEDGRVNAGGK